MEIVIWVTSDRLSDRPTPSDRPRMGRKRPDRPTHYWGPAGTISSKSTSRRLFCDGSGHCDVLVDLQKVCAYRFDLHHCTFQVTKDPKLA